MEPHEHTKNKKKSTALIEGNENEGVCLCGVEWSGVGAWGSAIVLLNAVTRR